ncbi:GNAT family N-acetyltransferase [Pelagibius marinus]|uniref:GNAT family N-acetyltransferase n=1 Tax=Pelagibius marinus TaxID=2762760 RepID=UPI001872317C|nr:GNAT family N-acetyltransferase [Pelagibius marinus]
MEITIRHAAPEDAAAVHVIFSQDHVLDGTQRLPYASPDYMRERLSAQPGVIKLVAEAEGRDGKKEVVGFAELITYPDNPRHHHAGEVNMITVHQDWQGKGVGRRLMEAMIDLADNWLQITRLSLIVWTVNENAIRLYEDLGFRREGVMPDYGFRRGAYVDALMMGRLTRRG